MDFFGWLKPTTKATQLGFKTFRVYHAQNRNGYCVDVQRIPATVDSAAYRPEYKRFSRIVQVNAIPSFVVDSAWTPEEKRRVLRWRSLLALPSTHIVVVWTEDPKRPRKILRAYLSLSGTTLSPDSSARYLGRSLMMFLQRNANSALLHPSLEEATLLSVIASRFGDLCEPNM